jgi:hypothetical protein
MSVPELVFDPHLVDELFARRLLEEITETISGSSHIPFDRSRFSNTQIAMERLSNHPEYRSPIESDPVAPYGRFRGRHIIGTGTRVLGGVYLGHSAREAIVVDETSHLLHACMLEFVERRFSNMRMQFLHGDLSLDFSHESILKEGMLQAFVHELPVALYAYAKNRLVFNERKTSVVFQEAHILPDGELSLDAYLLARTGVCRHMVLFIVALFEMLSMMSLTRGRMFVCRCYIPHMFSHAWVRFEQDGAGPFILDPAQNYHGPLEQGGEMGRFVYDHEFAKFFGGS